MYNCVFIFKFYVKDRTYFVARAFSFNRIETKFIFFVRNVKT